MKDKIQGYLEVGRDGRGDIVVNHPDLKPDANGVGHIVFSPDQARHFALLLLKHANESDREALNRRKGRARKPKPVQVEGKAS